jgi:hypothetical protein
LKSRKNLTPHIRVLEKKKFISTRTAGGKKYYLIHDPRVAIAQMLQDGDLKEEDLFEINDLLRDLKQPSIAKA